MGYFIVFIIIFMLIHVTFVTTGNGIRDMNDFLDNILITLIFYLASIGLWHFAVISGIIAWFAERF